MTEQDIDNLEAGAELDCLIEKHIISGETVLKGNYSTDWNDASKVLFVLRNSDKYCCLDLTSDYSYVFDFGVKKADDENHSNYNFRSTDESACVAICKTALKTIFLK